MEAIREYLSNMFMNLPETPQVLRAKAELMQIRRTDRRGNVRERSCGNGNLRVWQSG